MNDTAVGLYIVCALFAGFAIFGLVLRSVLLPPILSFDRDAEPIEYWAAICINGLMATLALYLAITSA